MPSNAYVEENKDLIKDSFIEQDRRIVRFQC